MANQITVDIVADTRNLVAGVKTTNSQLSSLNQQIGKVKTAFGGLASAFGFQIGASFLKDAIKGAEDDEVAFKRIGELFGKDAAAITSKINKLSSTWYIDDGAIAQYFVTLKAAFSSQFDKFVPQVTEAAIVLSKLTGKPLDEVITLWAKTLRDGKISAQEVQKLGIDLTAEQEQQFNKLKTSAERLQFLLDIINGPENKKKAYDNLTTTEKWAYMMERLSDTIGNFVLPILKKMFDFYDKLSPAQKGFVEGITALLVGLGAIAATMAPAVFVLKELGLTFGVLKTGIMAVITGLRALAIAAFTNPFTPVIIGIAALVVAIVLLVKNWDTVKAAFKTGIDAIKNAFNSVISWFGNVGNSIKNAIGNLFNIGKQFGVDIINGLVNGIKAMAMAPINAIKSVVSGVTGAIKSVLGIKSPSKVFAGFGKNIVQGLSNGIEGAQQLAAQSMTSLSGGLTLTPSYGTSRGAVNITINAGLGTDPYEMGRAVRAALNKYDGVNGK